MTESIRIGVDVGGTFTDASLVMPSGSHTAKVPTTTPQTDGVFDAIRSVCEGASVSPSEVDSFAHATTVATNALLEGSGPTTALVTTAGFRDVLEIGRQDRPSLYDLSVDRPEPLVPRRLRFEIAERAGPDGVIDPVDEQSVDALAAQLRGADVEAVAVCLLHAYAHPENERRVSELLSASLDVPVSVSHEVLGTFREFERTATTVIDAYVTPVIDSYLGDLLERATELGLPSPLVMQSAGGVATASGVRSRALETVLSGPAAGVVGATASAGQAPELITFDMGGTSTDVGVVTDGSIERTTEATIGGWPVATELIDVSTVGAGGGSIAWVDSGGALRVGPQSAGADPGPACYDRGGKRPTVTDSAALLGYLGASTTLGDSLALDVGRAERSLESLLESTDLGDVTAVAAGINHVVTATMARAIRSVTLDRGYDPRQFSLVAYGGAGPMFAAGLADRLSIETVTIPGASGVLSAMGLLSGSLLDVELATHRSRLSALDSAIERRFDELIASVREELPDEGSIHVERLVDCRYVGQSYEHTVIVGETIDPNEIAERFHSTHETVTGYRLDEPIETVTLRARATIDRPDVTVERSLPGSIATARTSTRPAWFDGEYRETPVYDRSRLPTETTVTGPAIVEGPASTTVVRPSWQARIETTATIELTRSQ
ncbi:hydantoinase/oxoprolinase family protein [Halocatena halophila]|uniref:hydantoinase/oxoprolinase family protein n=1 Tax=Halocatena halophila TaxID=2814576 RepID=UPI002ED1C663